MELLEENTFDLLTLDIEFDRLNEGIDILPEIFERHPTLNIIIISGRLNKNEITDQNQDVNSHNHIQAGHVSR